MPEDVKPVKKPAPEETSAPATETAKPATPGAAPKKKDNTLKIVLIVVGVVVGLGVIGTVASMIFLGSLFNNAVDNVDVDDGSVTIQSDDGSVTTVGEDAKLAEGFPSDVPIFEPSTIKGSTKVDNTQFSVVAATAKSVSDVTSYYKTQMAAQGWTNSLDSASEGSSLLTFTKDNRTASVIVSTSEEDSSEKTGFVVSVSTQE